jgi:hypothetical protein
MRFTFALPCPSSTGMIAPVMRRAPSKGQPRAASACDVAMDRSLAQPQTLCHRRLVEPLTQPSHSTSRIFRIDNLPPGISSHLLFGKGSNYLRLKTTGRRPRAAPTRSPRNTRAARCLSRR